jgi:hypothetical protein
MRCRLSSPPSKPISLAQLSRIAGRLQALVAALMLLALAEVSMPSRAAHAGEIIENTAVFAYTDAGGEDQSVISDTAVVIVEQVAAVSVAPADAAGCAGPGEVLCYPVTVTNEGSAADTFTLIAESASEPAWPITIFADDGAGFGIANDGIQQPG